MVNKMRFLLQKVGSKLGKPILTVSNNPFGNLNCTLNMSVILFKIGFISFLKIYLEGRVTDRGGETKRERSYVHSCFTLQLGSLARADPGTNQKPGTPSRSFKG